jgi:hypothetical protein
VECRELEELASLSNGLPDEKSLLVGDVRPNGSSSSVLGLSGAMWNSAALGDFNSGSRTALEPNASLGNEPKVGEAKSVDFCAESELSVLANDPKCDG